jgi:protein TonB
MKSHNLLFLLVELPFLFLLIFSGSVHAQEADGGYLPFAEKMPEPVGGIEAIYKKVIYPEDAKRTRLEGKVYVQVFVDESGSVSDVKVLKDIGMGCGNAVINAVKHVKYKPGQNKGVPVKVKLALAINFQLK